MPMPIDFDAIIAKADAALRAVAERTIPRCRCGFPVPRAGDRCATCERVLCCAPELPDRWIAK